NLGLGLSRSSLAVTPICSHQGSLFLLSSSSGPRLSSALNKPWLPSFRISRMPSSVWTKKPLFFHINLSFRLGSQSLLARLSKGLHYFQVHV
ncbi:hypothetical protein TorRG33x02_180030, partial [Trema orientale]